VREWNCERIEGEMREKEGERLREVGERVGEMEGRLVR